MTTIVDLKNLKVYNSGHLKVIPHIDLSTKSGRMVKALRFPVAVVCKTFSKPC